MRIHLRVARPTNDLNALFRSSTSAYWITAASYCDGLGFSVVGEFRDHEGLDGVMLGQPGEPYHLEFNGIRGIGRRALLRRSTCWSSTSPIRWNGIARSRE